MINMIVPVNVGVEISDFRSCSCLYRINLLKPLYIEIDYWVDLVVFVLLLGFVPIYRVANRFGFPVGS